MSGQPSDSLQRIPKSRCIIFVAVRVNDVAGNKLQTLRDDIERRFNLRGKNSHISCEVSSITPVFLTRRKAEVDTPIPLPNVASPMIHDLPFRRHGPTVFPINGFGLKWRFCKAMTTCSQIFSKGASTIEALIDARYTQSNESRQPRGPPPQALSPSSTYWVRPTPLHLRLSIRLRDSRQDPQRT